jgi:hypothetical protein
MAKETLTINNALVRSMSFAASLAGLQEIFSRNAADCNKMVCVG